MTVDIISDAVPVSRNVCSQGKKKVEDEDKVKDEEHQSKLEIKFFSFTTFYYFVSKLKHYWYNPRRRRID